MRSILFISFEDGISGGTCLLLTVEVRVLREGRKRGSTKDELILNSTL